MDFDRAIGEVYFTLIDVAKRYYYPDERAYDLAAEAVLRALQARKSYDESKPLVTWVRAIMRHLWLNKEQSLAVRHTLRLGDWDTSGTDAADQRVRVNDILRTLASRRSSVAVSTLIDFAKGYSIAEIAEARGVPQGTVRRRIHDARKLLRRVLDEGKRD